MRILESGTPLVDFIIAGTIKTEYIIPVSGRPVSDFIGGNLSYCVAGLLLWENNIGLISKVSRNFPLDRLDVFINHHCDIRGIKSSNDAFDFRSFFAFTDENNIDTDHPMAHFARIGHEFPKSLLGYTTQDPKRIKGNPFFIRNEEIPAAYLDASAAHICPADIRTHTSVSSTLRKGLVRTITLDPSEQYMHPNFWGDIRPLLKDINILIVSELKLRNLFKDRTTDIWEMADAIAVMGLEAIVIKCGKNGQLLYIRSGSKKIHIPAYPVKIENLAGVGDAFCGGFLAGYNRTFEPLEATLFGNISASIAIEIANPWVMLDPFPGFLDARLSMLRKNTRTL